MLGYPVSVRLAVQWGEMDAFGHVNNTRFFSWFESSRIAYLDRVGLRVRGGEGLSIILATTQADFLKPVVFPAELEVGARVSKVGRTSFSMEFEVQGTDGTVYGRGSCVAVVVRYPQMEKLLVPQEVREAMEALEGRAL